ncbi:bifunctional phosphopantothenoylcysteine decarboxylase/phosphopantothenate--cysteine ligase CoaBC [Phytoactinopolyspora halotolerans]|uniref:Coenzyme A biosynthesis bifunctional protein CoaBC n=1 Tax=Phytoactinopolyspora halotolerans TaxID=1981512 RepID=A0A6L9SI96_9ACTN|nr:bifunctional phosphopantothenoylcysteine decarboxylase/phosphopantothenate--cysteine ligase CoaBC [Phytoactinopolyspora halotolerans]NEE04061.1 bifunctional phosphopantothenoylcysteine decarboxylase/phosphopantothenate--cysteine ligase CoaBC [Phytoactinopolyspora halotolerans]
MSLTSDAPGGPGRLRVLLGVSGGIAAYKACEVLRRLSERGHDVRVLPTESALRFVGEPTWAALSGHPVSTSVFDDVHQVPHVALGQDADVVVVVPATADLLARAATGRADDLLTSTLLTARCPVVFAPAMHTEMWEHPAVVANVATLRARGNVVIEPAVGRLTGADSGKGRLPEPESIVDAALDAVSGAGPGSPDLAGLHVAVSAGGTREYLDPVRFIGNRSSGRQGYALARAAVSRGARVTLVAANVTLADVAGADMVRVESVAELREAMLKSASTADAVVMAAAVSDFRPRATQGTKIKKTAGTDAPSIELERTEDILAELSQTRRKPGQVVVGFAAETGDSTGSVLDYGRSKLAAKGCDLLVVNEVGRDRGFESEENEAVILGSDGSSTEVPYGPKSVLAHAVWDRVVTLVERPAG